MQAAQDPTPRWRSLQSLVNGERGTVRARASFRAYRWRGYSTHKPVSAQRWSETGEARCRECHGLLREHGWTRHDQIVCFGDWVVVRGQDIVPLKSADFYEQFEATGEEHAL